MRLRNTDEGGRPGQEKTSVVTGTCGDARRQADTSRMHPGLKYQMDRPENLHLPRAPHTTRDHYAHAPARRRRHGADGLRPSIIDRHVNQPSAPVPIPSIGRPSGREVDPGTLRALHD